MLKIGARNLKTAIAVFISLIICKLLKQTYPFYACIAAVICMQNSVENSFVIGKNRMIGTIIGGILGYLLSVLFGNSSVMCALGIIIVIYICNLLDKKGSVVISCIVFIAIMINLKDVSAFEYAVFRVIDTLIGILVAILVNKYIKIEKIKLSKLFKKKELD